MSAALAAPAASVVASREPSPRQSVSACHAAQRRQVSFLLVDVVGSMSLSQRMSAEEWWIVMEQMFLLLSDGVDEFDGWVDCFTGDGVAAVFAGDDDAGHAPRACAAALVLRDRLEAFGAELRRERGVALSARFGINTGDVVVGPVGRPDRARIVTIGHAAGLAKRIESLARPGRVYISGYTAKLVKDAFSLRDLGSFEIRGAHEPIALFELIGPRPFRVGTAVAEAVAA